MNDAENVEQLRQEYWDLITLAESTQDRNDRDIMITHIHTVDQIFLTCTSAIVFCTPSTVRVEYRDTITTWANRLSLAVRRRTMIFHVVWP